MLYFEPTLTLRDSYISSRMSGLSSWKAESLLRTPTWLRLGVKIKGTAFRDSKEQSPQWLFLCFKFRVQRRMQSIPSLPALGFLMEKQEVSGHGSYIQGVWRENHRRKD